MTTTIRTARWQRFADPAAARRAGPSGAATLALHLRRLSE
jgi:hypothetical protein